MNDATTPPETRTRQAEQLADRCLELRTEGLSGRDDVDRRHDVVKLHWEAGEVTAVGLVFRDYVFIER